MLKHIPFPRRTWGYSACQFSLKYNSLINDFLWNEIWRFYIQKYLCFVSGAKIIEVWQEVNNICLEFRSLPAIPWTLDWKCVTVSGESLQTGQILGSVDIPFLRSWQDSKQCISRRCTDGGSSHAQPNPLLYKRCLMSWTSIWHRQRHHWARRFQCPAPCEANTTTPLTTPC